MKRGQVFGELERPHGAATRIVSVERDGVAWLVFERVAPDGTLLAAVGVTVNEWRDRVRDMGDRAAALVLGAPEKNAAATRAQEAAGLVKKVGGRGR